MTKKKRLHKKESAEVLGRLHKAFVDKAAPVKSHERVVKPLHERVPPGATIRRQRVQCGKPTCSRWHGPYWYAAWGVGGKTKTAYIGDDAKLAAFLTARGHSKDVIEATDVDELDVALYRQQPGGAVVYRPKRKARVA